MARGSLTIILSSDEALLEMTIINDYIGLVGTEWMSRRGGVVT